MTPEMRRRVQAAWPTGEAADRLAGRLYERLLTIDPSCARLFAGTDMAVQRRRVAEVLAWVVTVLDAPERLVPAAADLGRRHATYGVTARHYALLGEAFRDALAESLGARYTPEVAAAWAEGYALLAGVMLRAAGHGERGAQSAERRASLAR
jgi:hemoglobin-like flavoprotein